MANLIRFENNDVVVDTQKVAVSTWTNNVNNLTTAFTSLVKLKELLPARCPYATEN